MSDCRTIHEALMNGSRIILPRVGGGVGVRGELRGAIHAFRLTRRHSRPVDNATAEPTHDRLAWMALREIGGGC